MVLSLAFRNLEVWFEEASECCCGDDAPTIDSAPPAVMPRWFNHVLRDF